MTTVEEIRIIWFHCESRGITGETQQWCKTMQNESIFSCTGCCQATCIHTSSQHLPVCVNAATRMTWTKRNNSNPQGILRLYSTNILPKTKKIQTRWGEIPLWVSCFLPSEVTKYNQKKCLKVRETGVGVLGSPASCELQHRIPASVREQLAIS